jgi:Protein of unknown function (DUF3142)
LAFAGCKAETQSAVKAEQYDSFWLWAGVKPQPILENAKQLYLHYGEVKAKPAGQLLVMRPQVPETGKRHLWLVVRTETLDWPESTYAGALQALDRWRAAGNNLAGLQIDFDAKTRHLQNYAVFLADLRKRLPKQYQLSITGLLDWSANGDPAGLHAIGNSVDELVLQVYQGRQTIPGYERYLGKLDRLGIPFRIGLVQGGEWKAPPSLSANPDFRGFVVFLVNEKRSD